MITPKIKTNLRSQSNPFDAEELAPEPVTQIQRRSVLASRPLLTTDAVTRGPPAVEVMNQLRFVAHRPSNLIAS